MDYLDLMNTSTNLKKIMYIQFQKFLTILDINQPNPINIPSIMIPSI